MLLQNYEAEVEELPGSTSVALQNQTKCLMCQRSLLVVEGHTVATVAPLRPILPGQSPPGLSTGMVLLVV